MIGDFNHLRLFFYLFIIFSSHLIFSQPISQVDYQKKYYNIMFNSGHNWEYLSSINSIRKHNYKTTSQYIKKMNFIGFSYKNNLSKFTFHGYNKFKTHFFSYINCDLLNIVNQNIDHKNNIQINFSGLGFQNNWFTFQLGRGNENWGAGNDIELALSSNANSYDYFLLGSDYGRIRVNYFHGFLESLQDSVNRYINGRGIEWTNKKSLIIFINVLFVLIPV